MNALKHMELIFGVVVVAGCVAAAMPAAEPTSSQSQPTAQAVAARAATATTAMPVVVVKGKRMTALEKRASLGAGTGGRDGTAGT